MDYASLLNKEQLKPVVDTEGAVLVLAGAGSGKTRVLTYRIAYLIDELNVNPYSILAITFTNKAAGEMKKRVLDLTGRGEMWISTFHSFCARVLRSDIDKLGDYTSRFTIYSESDSNRVVTKVLKELDLDDGEIKKQARWHISNAKNSAKSPEEYRKVMVGHPLADKVFNVYLRYEQVLRENNALDFDDLLLKTINLFRLRPDVLLKYQERFQYIHIDEFQDTNRIQYTLVKELAQKHGNLFVVGDDDQSIYGWRGADIRNILDFQENYPDCRVYKLEQNYRSTSNILNLANKIIANNHARTGKVLWTDTGEGNSVEYRDVYNEDAEADYVMQQIDLLKRNGIYTYKDFAILVRANSITRGFEEKLNLYNIPYKLIGGFKFFERKEIKDFLAYVSIALNNRDNENIMRVINIPKRGLGAGAVNKLLIACNQYGINLYEGIMDYESLNLPTAMKKGLDEFRFYLKTLANAISFKLDKFAEIAKDTLDFKKEYKDQSDESYSKLENIDELITSMLKFAADNENSTIETYMQSVALMSDTDDLDDDEYVTVATVHGVKGLEYKVVFVVGLEDGLFPSIRIATTEMDIEEERRIMYVAITRARERLYLTSAQSRFRFGNREYNMPSRFLSEAGLIKKKADVIDMTRRRDEGSIFIEGDKNSSFGMKKKEAPESNKGELKKGMTIQHSVYGVGQIVEIDGSFADIMFSIGCKKVALNSSIKAIEKYKQFTVGSLVNHDRFGQGTIVEITGENGKINFPTIGTKIFNLRLAPLKFVDKENISE